MNIIEYISTQEDYLSLFEDTFDSPIESYHLDNINLEASTKFYTFRKDAVDSINEFIMISIVQDFVRFGDYYFDGIPKKAILEKVTEHLNMHYADAQFDLTKKISLEKCVERYSNQELTAIYINKDRNQVMKKEDFFRLPWTKEKTLKAYQIKFVWNDEDYLFETENHFIRFNWNTSA